MGSLSGKQIIVGVTGGIAAYKSAEIVRRLRELGGEVRVVMTTSAMEFIRPLTLQALSGNPVHTKLVDAEAEAGMGHIELARWADLMLVAPATANTISDLVQGRANTLLGSIHLATSAHVLLAPAMNQAMWHHPANLANVTTLKERGVQVIEPDTGPQACGDVGLGRMQQPDYIVERISAAFNSGLMLGKKLVITAGPTREAIDPVRYLSNHSSGRMGYALANAAVEEGGQVTLISGPVSLSPPERCTKISVISAEEMCKASMEACRDAHIFIGAAAVSDYRCASISQEKIKRKLNVMSLALEKNVDIVGRISDLKSKIYMVGFAAETENLIENATRKLYQKKLDAIVANDVSRTDIGFNGEENEVYWITPNSRAHIGKRTKTKLARNLVRLIASDFDEREAMNRNTG